jgi:ubiquinone/menaquinone biosynthesis C-methylase UbiE
MDGKARAKQVWGASPTGWTAAGGALPGTAAFFERALKHRSEHEQPWLPEVVPFHAMGGLRVLEIGCGPGYDALTLLQNGALYSGIDIAPENIERTRKHLAPYGFEPDVREGDAEALSFPDATFDVVYSNGVLHHVPSIATALAECKRVLKPGGCLYLVVYNRLSIFAQVTMRIDAWRKGISLEERLTSIEANVLDAQPIVNVYSRKEVRALLSAAGFVPVSLTVRKLVREDLPFSRLAFLYRRIPQRLWTGSAGRSGGISSGMGGQTDSPEAGQAQIETRPVGTTPRGEGASRNQTGHLSAPVVPLDGPPMTTLHHVGD